MKIDQMPFKVVPGNIVQVDPEKDKCFAGSFVLVTEVREWGIIGFVQIPGSGQAWVRKKWEDVEWCGQAEWIYQEPEEKDATN